MALVPDDCAINHICGKAQLIELIYNLISFAQSLAIMVVGIAVLWGGFLIMTSAGNDSKVTQGRKAITSAVVGVAIIFSAWLIVNTIITILLPNCSGQWSWNVIGGEFKCQ